MKKFFLFMLAAFTISSCVKDVDPTSYEQTKDQVLTDNFNTTFGVTEAQYANHRWGMNTVPLVVTSTSASRAIRAANTNANQWEDQGYVLPAEITRAEIEKVKAVFAEKGKASYESLVNWDTKKHTQVKCWWPYEEEVVIGDEYDDHINNFNAGNCTTSSVSEKTGTEITGAMLMYNSDTYKFGFKSSEDNGHVFYNFRMEEIDGNYYVGFDFEAAGQNPNEQVARDYVYDDWIVKIVPGKGVTPPVSRVRVMAEDLGTMSSDFDYNDVVFDILFVEENGSYKADIILQAAGGTLPLYIGEGEGNTYEVHALFGVGTDVMVNTHAEDRGLKGKSNLAPVPFTVNLPSGKNYATMKAEDAVDALNITVKIGNNTVHLTPKASYDNYSNAPKMIVAPVGTEWVDERILISKVYNKFVDWISDPTIKWWEK